MKKNYFKSLLNDLMVASTFTLATKISEESTVYGIITYLIAYLCLDYHSYVDKKLNYPNNLFIHH